MASRCLGLGDNWISELTEALDAYHDFFSRPEEPRWLAGKSDAARRAGGDHIARFQGHDRGNPFDQLRDPEHQLPGVGMLHDFAIDFERNIQRMRIGDL